MKPLTFAIFDTETTGLTFNSLKPINKQPHVVEFYGCLWNDKLGVIGELEFLCKPPIPMPEEAFKSHKISDDMVANEKPFAEYADGVIELLSKADGVVAHNLNYDYSIITFEMIRLGKPISWPIRRICTVENTEHLAGTRLKLTDLHKHLFGEEIPERHRARPDTEVLTRCFAKLREDGVV